MLLQERESHGSWQNILPLLGAVGFPRAATASTGGAGGEGEEDGSCPHSRGGLARHEGQQYLVSMLGECEWVKTVRAQGDAYVISGRRRKVWLEEVPVERRAPIIKEYIRLAPGARPHIELGTTATIADCERVAPNHPVFRILYQDAPARCP